MGEKKVTILKLIKQVTSALLFECVFQMTGARTLTCLTQQCCGSSFRRGLWAMVHSCQGGKGMVF